MCQKQLPVGRDTRIRRRLEAAGRVQGVGFRPSVYRLATEMGLTGVVGNHSRGAFIEVEGTEAGVDAFIERLPRELPPLASIARLQVEPLEPTGEDSFRIDHSTMSERQDAEITPDMAVCADCLAEMFDPANRRYRYPLINCTNCGPRYSIILEVPYDRPNTTMARFRMCPACQAEYDDPADRRFHAQPNACPACGPRVWLTGRHGKELEGDPIRQCAQHLTNGEIVAIRGLGGFHLACRADSERAVRKLRIRKGREARPLAVMVASIEEARALAHVGPAAAAALEGPERPIVLVPRRGGGLRAARAASTPLSVSFSPPLPPVCESVAPGIDSLGIMLPYTPLQHLLFAEGLGPLIMTSANPTAEPLCRDNDEALERLADIADAFLLHDRDIERRVDDSVVCVASPSATRDSESIVPLRRARGYAPAPIRVPASAPEPILALGGDLKAAVCLLSGEAAVLSEHLGELENPQSYRNFIETIDRLQHLLRVRPWAVAHDMHPDYFSTRFARSRPWERIAVQHHHAHIVSGMVEHGLTGRVVGVACDGTGYGTDGAIWGCEVLVCDEANFERPAHLRYFPLSGGDSAAKETWRPALSLLRETFGSEWKVLAARLLPHVPPEAIAVTDRRLKALPAATGPPMAAGATISTLRATRLPQTSSLGRLFDAVACLLGLCTRNRYEAEAAMILEATAARCPEAEPFRCRIARNDNLNRPARLDWRPMVRDLVDGLKKDRPVAELARAFHETVAAMLADAALAAARDVNLKRIVLSGGCFANRLLLESLSLRIRRAGHQVFFHEQVPTGDGGLCLGQAVIAAEQLRRHR